MPNTSHAFAPPRIAALVITAAVAASAVAVAPVTAAEPASADTGGIRINEVESSDAVGGKDWIEFHNTGETAFDLSGWRVQDNSEKNPFTFAAGTVVAPGGFLTIDEGKNAGQFDFGLGGEDQVRLFDADGALFDQTTWSEHAATTYGVNDAGEWAVTAEPTKNAPNVFPAGGPVEPADVVLNEVDSAPVDWVELFNREETPVDLGGYELRDNNNSNSWKFAPGSVIEPGGFLVVEENTVGTSGGSPSTFTDAIGIGSSDKIRLFTPDGTLMDDTEAWSGHAMIEGDTLFASYARCPDGQGDFGLASPTPGASNECVDPATANNPPFPPLVTNPWPGTAETRTLDTAAMFLEDSSGLDVQETAEGAFLWAVDNGEGRFWKLGVEADGSASFAPGWESGKRVRFQKDADDPAAAGPDTEGITVAGDGSLFFASERDNGAKGVNANVVLQADPDAPGPDVVASQEWNLTEDLPQVNPNYGIEAIEWVADGELAGELIDDNTGEAYDPALYPLHGDGLFFLAVETRGQLFAYALNSDGTAQRIAEIAPGMPRIMALDYDTVRGGLWAVCDNDCQGSAAFITLNGTAEPAVELIARPAGLPDTNNEGFATAPASLAVDGERPVWWFTDGVRPGALQAGSITVTEVEPPAEAVATAVSAKAAKQVYGKPAKIAITVSKGASGKVSVKAGSKTVVGTLKSGKATLTIPAKALKPGTRTVSVSYAGVSGEFKPSKTSTKVTVAKAAAKVSVSAPKKAKAGKIIRVSVAVTATGVKPTGKVTVKLAGTKAKTVKLKPTGRVTVKLKAPKRAGAKQISVSYAGDAYTSAKKPKAAKLRVSR